MMMEIDQLMKCLKEKETYLQKHDMDILIYSQKHEEKEKEIGALNEKISSLENEKGLINERDSSLQRKIKEEVEQLKQVKNDLNQFMEGKLDDDHLHLKEKIRHLEIHLKSSKERIEQMEKNQFEDNELK